MATPVRFSAPKPGAKAAPRTKFNGAGVRARVTAAGGGSKPTGTQWASIRDGSGGGGRVGENVYRSDIPD